MLKIQSQVIYYLCRPCVRTINKDIENYEMLYDDLPFSDATYGFMDNYLISYLIFTLIGIFFIYGAIKKAKFFMYDKRVSYFLNY